MVRKPQNSGGGATARGTPGQQEEKSDISGPRFKPGAQGAADGAIGAAGAGFLGALPGLANQRTEEQAVVTDSDELGSLDSLARMSDVGGDNFEPQSSFDASMLEEDRSAEITSFEISFPDVGLPNTATKTSTVDVAAQDFGVVRPANTEAASVQLEQSIDNGQGSESATPLQNDAGDEKTEEGSGKNSINASAEDNTFSDGADEDTTDSGSDNDTVFGDDDDQNFNTAPGSPGVASGGSVAENSADGTTVATLSATDIDGDTLTYTLTDSGGAPLADPNFEIVGNEIRVKTGADIDYESATSHGLYVTASDAYETSAPQTVTVTVTDVNEFAVSEITLVGETNGVIDQTNYAATDSGYTVTARTISGSELTDANVSHITADSGGIGVAGSTGSGSPSRQLGYDAAKGLSEEIIVDFDGPVSNAEFTANMLWSSENGTFEVGRYTLWNGGVDVGDGTFASPNGQDFATVTIDNGTVFDRIVFSADPYDSQDAITNASSDYYVGEVQFTNAYTVTENAALGTTVLTAVASDADGSDDVTFLLSNDAGGLFAIDSSTGEVTVDGAIDWETAMAHVIEITATSDDGSTSTRSVTLAVQDTAETIVLGNGGETFTDFGVAETSITGGTGANTITANDAGGTTIDGGAGGDSLRGGAGDDILDGGADADTFTVEDSFGNDTITGGAGGTDDDVIDLSGLSGPVTVTYTGDEAGTITDGTDTITFSQIERIITTEQDDSVDAGADSIAGYESIDGAGGDDTIIGGRGWDTIQGGSGNDSVQGGFAPDIIHGGEGNDTLLGNRGSDSIYGGDGDDSIEGGNGGDWDRGNGDNAASHDYIEAGAGNDYVGGGDGDDTIYGGAGNDTLNGNNHDDYLDGGDDADTFIISHTGNDTIIGGEGGTDDDVIDLTAMTGPVTVTYTGDEAGTITDGTDTITFSEVERFLGTDQNDLLDAWTNSVVTDLNVVAGGGDDTVRGFEGNDTMSGGTGNDYLDAWLGNDSLDGGAGNDTLASGVGEDTLFGGDGDDVLWGGTGADSIRGGSGADTIYIEDSFGNDTITGGEGGTDDDAIDMSALSGPVTVTYSDDEEGTITDGTDTITFSEVERLILTEYADVVDASADGEGINIDAGAGNDTIYGGSGDDSVEGGAGDDELIGEDGNDTLHGGEGNDAVYGNAGADVLTGGAGVDTVVGGTGDDVFLDSKTDATNSYETNVTDLSPNLYFRFEETSGGTTADDTGSYVGTANTGVNFNTDGINRSSSGADLSGADSEIVVANDGNLIPAQGTYQFWINPDTLGGRLLDLNGNGAAGGLDVRLDANGDLIVTLVGGGETAMNLSADGAISTGVWSQIAITYGDGNVALYVDGALADSAATSRNFANGSNDIVIGARDDGGSFQDHFDGQIDDFAVFDSVLTGSEIGQLQQAALAEGDQYEGGAGTDEVDYSGSSEAVGVDLSGVSGSGGGDGAARHDTFSNIENVTGSSFDDTLTGDAGANVLDGGAGDDTLVGGAGGDTLEGGTGDDSVLGGAGADMLRGGAGSDTIDGGAGNDTISADAGAAGPAPIIRMDFEDGISGVAADRSGNGHDGTYQGDANAGGTGWDGNGTALQLDGSGDYVEIPNDPAFSLSAGTVSIRFNADALTGDQALFSRDSMHYDGGGHFTAFLRSDGSVDVRLQSDSGDTWVSSAPGSVSAGNWAHVAVTFGPEGMELYLDGSLVATDAYTGGIDGNAEPWVIGANQWSSGDGVADSVDSYFDGAIDEFGLFGEQLNAAEVSALNTGGIDAVGGDNQLSGGDDADTFIVRDNFGSDTISGGEGGTDSDVIDLTALTGMVTVTYTGDEAGTITDGNDTITFSEIEQIDYGPAGAFIDKRSKPNGDPVQGGAGNDTIFGSSEEDLLLGGAGDDVIYGFQDNDTMDGGEGSDLIILSDRDYGASNLVTDSGTTGTDTIEFARDDGSSGTYRIQGTFSAADGIEVIDGSTDTGELLSTYDSNANFDFTGITLIGVDEIEGTANADTITGSAGADYIDGGDGSDVLAGGAGDDSIETGTGADTVDGGEGSDRILLNSNSGGTSNMITDTGTAGTDTLVLDSGSGSYEVQGTFSAATSGIEVVEGSGAGGEMLRTFDSAADFDFSGITMTGVDEIQGTSGNDTIAGSSGADYINGADGADSLVGGAGDDSIRGGSGNDTMNGGDGDDVFYVAAMQGGDMVQGGAGGGWTDIIELEGMGAGAASQTGDTVDGDGWTMVIDGGHSVTSLGSGVLELSSDASGVINFDDGGSMSFAELERVTW